MELCEGIDKPTIQKAIDLLQASIDDDFKKQARNRDVSSVYFRDVGAVMPGFTNGVDVKSIRVHVDLSLLKR